MKAYVDKNMQKMRRDLEKSSVNDALKLRKESSSVEKQDSKLTMINIQMDSLR